MSGWDSLTDIAKRYINLFDLSALFSFKIPFIHHTWTFCTLSYLMLHSTLCPTGYPKPDKLPFSFRADILHEKNYEGISVVHNIQRLSNTHLQGAEKMAE